MIGNLKRWAGAALVLSAVSIGAGSAHGQGLGYDFGQYQRDRWQAQRDYNQLNLDIATGNTWGVLRDASNIQQDRRDLYQDRQNIQADVQYQPQPYAPGYGGGYGQPPSQPQASPWGG